MGIRRLAAENLVNFLQNGLGLRYSYNQWVVARDRRRGYALLGGLGGCGVGEMWFKDEPFRDFCHYEGYAEAPEVDSTNGFGRKRVKWKRP